MKRYNVFVAAFLCASALATAAAGAKTLVYCSEGSPENFTPAINTTGTSFDAARPVYNQLTEFERGTTNVVPGLAESWDGLRRTARRSPSICARASSSIPASTASSRRATSTPTTCSSRSSGSGRPDNPYAKVSGGNYDYFNDMDMPKLLEVDREDRRLHRDDEAQRAERADPRQSGDGFRHHRLGRIRRVPARRRARPSSSTRCRSAPARSQFVDYQKDAVIRYKAFDAYWGGKAQVRRSRLRHHARSRPRATPS